MSWQPRGINETKRVGTFETKSGVITTPVFMPDATRAAVRGLSIEDLRTAGIEALVINTYHLYLRPGEELIKKAGDTHRFMAWLGPLISDSGGYQIFSLIHKNPELGKITEDGAEFRSVLDGSTHIITPERSIEIQFDLGSDIIICLDDPRPNMASEEEIKEAVDRTTRWAERCKNEYDRQLVKRKIEPALRPLIFGVVQGGMSRELRKRSADGLIKLNFDGYGFGARHVDDEGNFLEDIIGYTASLLPKDKPRFALGVGTPQDIARCFEAGWDMFDCVIPTREGRHGRLFVWKDHAQSLSNIEAGKNFYETLNIQNEKHREDFSPVDVTCDCMLCAGYTRSYLRHLFTVGDPLGGRLASIHNLRFYSRLIEKLRV